MINILLVFIGGGLGSVARYAMTHMIGRATPGWTFPWHTLGVNILGAFTVGLLLEMMALRIALSAPARYFLVTGVLGGFTTFSAFSLESALMFEKGDYVTMLAYIAASVIGTIMAVFAGSAAVRTFL